MKLRRYLPAFGSTTRIWLLAGLVLSLAGFRLLPPDDLAVLRHIVLSVQQFYDKARPETVYLHLDKDTYTAGETIWLRAYVADAGQHRLDTLSKVLHIDLISARQQLVSRRTLELAGGLGQGDLTLPDTLAPGTYLLRAYTGWMRNAGPDFFYTRRLQVWPVAEAEAAPGSSKSERRPARQAQHSPAPKSLPPDVQFFPEGGNLVAGIGNVVAFKAVDYTGRGLAVAGQVLDSDNHPVATFQSRHGGMGTLRFTPAEGQRYRATFSTPALAGLSVPLPAAQAKGYVLQVVPTADAFEITIRQHGSGGGPILLLGQVGSNIGYIGRGQVQGPEAFMARVPKSKFASGVVHFTLFDGQGHPLAERLAFAGNEAALHITLTPDRAVYKAHEPVRVVVAVTDATGRPAAAQLSLAVADANATIPAADNIAARLLLTADLAGYVEDPGYYFQNPSPETDQALDDLLLTQGWRRFAWEPVLAGQAPSPDFGVERSLGIMGQLTQPSGTPSPHSVLTYLQAKPTKQIISVETDDEGRFLLNGLGGCDTLRATLQARTAKGRRNLAFHLDNGPALPTQPLPPLPTTPEPPLAAAIQRSQAQQADEQRYRTSTTIALGTVRVQGTREVVADTRRLYSPGNATVVDFTKIPAAASSTVLQLLQGRVAGLTITGSEPNIQVQIRGNTSFSGSSPLVLLDGVPVTIDALAFYPAFDIERVEVLKGGQAAIFGSRGSGGVLAVYTRRGNPTYDHRQDQLPGVFALRQAAFNCPRQFYAPRYGAGAPPLTRPDNRRSTLYWNPTISIDASGQAQLTFYTSEATGSFRLSAEGISPAGQPALGSNALEVQ
ncbi:TonB-dependent receptor plug domain-containing protein [Hymenobacter sp. BRD67]|uniref:TonB-dependent receptor plug domain-containing protein n=1 Tax=Hymenobacter sp. BRD67 TaxID=2675877 RepID=UPI001566311D|nr:TonB-dependent receptor plug domain-containing protein [Hymenobacter sp. BRD67]QKG54319.1 TonB-dependent receptor plug domain-containing protein [Hymenobacter sp. BRD67]